MKDKTVRTKEAIYKDLYQLYLCDHKRYVDHDMQQGRDRALEHFLLAEGYEEHRLPPLAGMIGEISRATEHDIAVYIAKATESDVATAAYKNDKTEGLNNG